MAPRPQAGADPRALALDVLEGVLDGGAPLEESFGARADAGSLSPRDRAFARLLATTTLRRLGQIDAILRPRLKHWPKEHRTRDLLRLGVAQLLFLRTPAHAAVGETVALAQKWHGNATGLANAVLRKIATEGAALLETQDAGRLNTPGWLWQSWARAYGERRAQAIAKAHLAEPPLDLSVKDRPQAWAEPLEAEILPNGTLRRRLGGTIEAMPGYGEGTWWVQDVAASLPARLLGDVRGLPVLDLCAAPGGKTCQVAAAGGHVVAVELVPERAARLRTNLARVGLEAEVVEADLLMWDWHLPFPRVLLDVPCTATGTIRRHPDVAWHRKVEDPRAIAVTQLALLNRAVDLLASGGLLVYASCSLQPEEGPDVVAALLAGRSDVARDPIRRDELGGLPLEPTPEGEVRTLPSDLGEKGGMDGFFIARLGKIGNGGA